MYKYPSLENPLIRVNSNNKFIVSPRFTLDKFWMDPINVIFWLAIVGVSWIPHTC